MCLVAWIVSCVADELRVLFGAVLKRALELG